MKILNKNRSAYFEYQILNEYIAGIQLLGSEIKPVKNNFASIKEAYCYIKENEVFINGMNIPIDGNNPYNHKPNRLRKLLLNKIEIKKIGDSINQKGLTLIPLSINLTDSGLIKIKLGVGKGKKLYNKKNTLREKDLDLKIKREIKGKL